MDLNANGGKNLTLAYAVYEDGVPSRVLLISHVDDATDVHDVTARITIGGGETGQTSLAPQQVRVTYFKAPRVSFKGTMIWVGEFLGTRFEFNSCLQGQEVVQTIQCDIVINTCAIPLKAPLLAPVFLSDAAVQNSSLDGSASPSVETSMKTNIRHSAAVDQAVLATSNKQGGSKATRR